jgi:methanol--5-hydroxybenzimidazolylcobamide Co-methyltransferase
LAINSADQLLYGLAPKPVACGRGVVLGGGDILPEINFTLPPMTIEDGTWGEVRSQYTTMIDEICRRCVDLSAPGLVVECELLPPMCLKPEWGAEITEILRSTLDQYHASAGLRSALRMTIIDLRDGTRPPKMRSGPGLDRTLESFELCARAGADLLSIESTGGKEVHDEVLINAHLPGILFALGSLASNDMQFLWGEIEKIAKRTGSLSAGDSACGFANTAMVLADRGMLPRVLAAVVRVASVVRSLQAFEQGAVGPSKDCAYEGPFVKALAGVPISMEGKSAACAHLSGIGNIAAACADLWSNESVQNVRLLSASAPVVSMEQLIYDCRLMNRASKDGEDERRRMQRWLVESDSALDPQAWVLRPDFVIEASRVIANATTPLEQTLRAAEFTLSELRRAYQTGELPANPTEQRWLDRLSRQMDSTPHDAHELSALVREEVEINFLPEEYGL